ncbi:MAG: hypothetical protein GY755_23890 [Chloroflexi bacterium]|nr:hypothetical protein [Chloroflexota bacterium]
MDKLDVGNKLFLELKSNPPTWWENLLRDEDLYIEIRKDNYIDVYFNGGGIIRKLKFTRGEYSGSIHFKYLLSDKAEYIKYDFTTPKVFLAQEKIKLLSFVNFDPEVLRRIKNNIKNHYSANSEKGIQARFINKAGCFLDTEFAYNYADNKLRIDLIWVDKHNKKILFVELKTMGDSRLYTNEIHEQLKKYHDFSCRFEGEIVDYYQKLFAIKKSLNILPAGLKSLDSLEGFTLEKKPLLLFGDCNQVWINQNTGNIDKRIKNVAIGAYYFGGATYNCDLIPKTKKNRHVF